MAEALLLAFDFGTRRIGVAVGNSVTQHARPVTVISDPGDRRWQAIGELINAWAPTALVVGLPRHPDGTAHEMTTRCERFARQLEGRYRLPVVRVDERYSTTATAGGDDADAAAIILQQHFDALAASAASDQVAAAGAGQYRPASSLPAAGALGESADD